MKLRNCLCALQLMFAVELNRRLSSAGIPVAALSLHPGNVMSGVVRSLPPVIQRLYRMLMKRVLLTPEQGMQALTWFSWLSTCWHLLLPP